MAGSDKFGTAWTFVRSRRCSVLLLIAAALASGELLLPIGPVEVPLITGQTTVAVYLMPLLAIVVWPMCAVPPSPDIERMLPQTTMRLRRAWWYLGVTALLASVGIISLGLRVGDPLAGIIVGRAVIFGIALATLFAVITEARFAWIAPLMVALVIWLYGTVDDQGTAAWWALPLYPLGSVLASVSSAASWLISGLLYILKDGHIEID